MSLFALLLLAYFPPPAPRPVIVAPRVMPIVRPAPIVRVAPAPVSRPTTVHSHPVYVPHPIIIPNASGSRESGPTDHGSNDNAMVGWTMVAIFGGIAALIGACVWMGSRKL